MLLFPFKMHTHLYVINKRIILLLLFIILQNLYLQGQQKDLIFDSLNTENVLCFSVNGQYFKMIFVKGGVFTMSFKSTNSYNNKNNVQQVFLSDYYIGETEVTQSLWEAVMGYNPSKYIGENLPVNFVSWNDCQIFISKLNQLTGRTFRLPTEAEWEYAAKGGNKSKGYIYSGSNIALEVAWYDEDEKKPHLVGLKKPNELGLYDMSGNVYEWCQDWYREYDIKTTSNPQGPIYGTKRVIRSCSWFDFINFCDVTNRGGVSPEYGSEYYGFRLVMQVPKKDNPFPHNNIYEINEDKYKSDLDSQILSSDTLSFVQVSCMDSGKSQIFTINKVKFKMIYVNGGVFTMGSIVNTPNYAEIPIHQVTLSDYYIGETEVTQSLWEAVMGYNPSKYIGENLPVNFVSWNDCQIFISKLNQLTGRTFRLPTEAEWEYAAKGGNKSKGYIYSGSNIALEVAWYNSGNEKKIHPVGGKKPNELGLYDMSGNVYEICQDWYGEYTNEAQVDPQGPISGERRVVRSCCWFDTKDYCENTMRWCVCEKYGSEYRGLRLVLIP